MPSLMLASILSMDLKGQRVTASRVRSDRMNNIIDIRYVKVTRYCALRERRGDSERPFSQLEPLLVPGIC